MPRAHTSSTSLRTMESIPRVTVFGPEPCACGGQGRSPHSCLPRQESVEGRAVVSEHIPLHSKRVGKDAHSTRLVDEVRRQESVLL